MRINLDWLMGLLMVGLMVGVPFGFEWYNNPRYVKALVKALFTVIQLAGGVLGVFFIIDKLFEFNGWSGRAFMTIMLIQPVEEIYVNGFDGLNVGFIVLGLIAYVFLRVRSGTKE